MAYSNSFGNGFALDSRAILENDARIREASAANLALIATKDYWWPSSGDLLYRPVTTASYLFNYAILGTARARRATTGSTSSCTWAMSGWCTRSRRGC